MSRSSEVRVVDGRPMLGYGNFYGGPFYGRGDQGKFSHFAIKSTKKPMYQQILENEYCI